MSKGNNHLKLEDMKKYYVTEKSSMKMQELLAAIKDMTYEEITAIRGTMWWRPEDKKQLIVRDADKNDLEYALRILGHLK